MVTELGAAPPHAQYDFCSIPVQSIVGCFGGFDDTFEAVCMRKVLAKQVVSEADSSCSSVDGLPSSPYQQCCESVSRVNATPQPAAQCDLRTAVMFQSFGWDSWQQHPHSFYQHVQSKLSELQASGISHVWLPPPSHSVSPQGYMPDQLYDLHSAYGNEAQLKECIAALRAAGISAIADIVINHRCADEQDESGRWNCYRDKVPHDGPSMAWSRAAIAKYGSGDIYGGCGRADSGGVCWGGAPNLDHNNVEVREGLTAWLRHLQYNVGFDAWRFDFARGYSSKHVQTYVDRTTSQFSLNVGEVWIDLDWSGPGGALAADQDAARHKLRDWVSGCQQRSTVFDFVTKGVLTEAVKHNQYWRLRDEHGRAAGFIGWLPGSSVTFIDNHDTGSSQQHWPFPQHRLALGYAYILTHPGVPCIFGEHYCTDRAGAGAGGAADDHLRNTIHTLLQARRRVGITATSSLCITAADDDLYVAVVAGDRGQLTVKLGPRYDMGDLLPQAPYWKQLCCGDDFCVWESCNIAGCGGSSSSLCSGSSNFGACSGSSGSLCG